MTTLLLVRHGATAWNHAGRLQGRADVELSDRGREGAVALAPVVASWQPRSLVVSPLRRARETARLLSELPPTVDESWTEHGLGEWEGSTPDRIGVDYPRWRDGRLVPPGGEELADIRARVTAAVRSAAELPGPVLVVTHGGTIRHLLHRFVGLSAAHVVPVAAPSLTVVEVEVEAAPPAASGAGGAAAERRDPDAGHCSARLRHFNVGAELLAAGR